MEAWHGGWSPSERAARIAEQKEKAGATAPAFAGAEDET